MIGLKESASCRDRGLPNRNRRLDALTRAVGLVDKRGTLGIGFEAGVVAQLAELARRGIDFDKRSR